MYGYYLSKLFIIIKNKKIRKNIFDFLYFLLYKNRKNNFDLVIITHFKEHKKI